MENQKDNSVKDNNMSQVGTVSKIEFVFLKSEKVASALYMVTSIISDNEPLKWKIRNAALDIVSDITAAKRTPLAYRKNCIGRLRDRFENLVALFDLGLASGSVSEMNFKILKVEVLSLIESITQILGNFQDVFAVEMPLLAPALQDAVGQKQSISPVSFQKLSPEIPRNTRQYGEAIEKPSFVTRKEGIPNTRREAILGFIRGKDWTAIKDIADAVPDCSVKTVQRELAVLVNEGILKKKGDRRWSRYLLS